MTLMTYFNDLIDLKDLLAQTPLSLKRASTHPITNY